MIDSIRFRAVAATLLLITATTVACPALAATVSGAPYELNALLPLTGPGTFIGQAAKKDLDFIQDIVNASGGIQGHPLKFIVSDDQASPQVSVQLMSGLIAKDVPVVLGGALANTCLATAPLVQSKGPVQYCLSPGLHPTRGSYEFSASVGVFDDALGTVRFFRSKGWTRIAIITTTDAIGQEMDRSFAAVLALPENISMKIIATEHYNPSDISVAGQIAHIKAADPQAIITWATGTPFGTLLHGIHDAGLDIPVSASTGNMSFAQMAQYASFTPSQLYFAGLPSLSQQGVGRGPVKRAQDSTSARSKRQDCGRTSSMRLFGIRCWSSSTRYATSVREQRHNRFAITSTACTAGLEYRGCTISATTSSAA